MCFRIAVMMFFVKSQTKILLKLCECKLYSAQRSAVGFIGLGNMGSQMVKNLIKKGEQLVVYDQSPAALEQFIDVCNVKIADNLKDMVGNCDHIITMLPNDKIVSSVYNDDDGIIRNCKRHATFIDCSTIDPSVAQKLAITAETKDCVFIDGPVSGGVVGAQNGTLVFMVGGSEEACKMVEKLLLKMGSRVVRCGNTGCGQATKLCNNMLLGITMIAVSEALNIGVRFGLDGKLLLSVINTSSGRCWSSDTNPPISGVVEHAPSNRDYKDGFKTSLLIKDLSLATRLATNTQSATYLSTEALKLYQQASDNGFSDKDFSSIYTYLRDHY